MSEPAVSIVIPTYRRPQLLRRAISSVYAQTTTAWELIISDDEDAPGEFWTMLWELSKQDVRIKVARNPGAHGQSGNMNNALRMARADWIKPLYDDDVLRPNCLATMLEAVHGHSVALATCLADHYQYGKLARTDLRGNRPRIEVLDRKKSLLAMYLQDVDIGIPSQVLVNRTCIDHGVLLEESSELILSVNSWWFARILELGDLMMVNEVLIEEHQGQHRSVTSAKSDHELDVEFELLRDLMYPMIDRRLAPPSPRVAKQMIKAIRALHRASNRRLLDALAMVARVWHPHALWLAIRWALRRKFPGRFEIVMRRAHN